MDRCQLTGNSATEVGGALAVVNCKLKISNSKLIKNEANINGGVLYLRDDASCTISHSQLLQNKARLGGALFITSNVTSIGSHTNFRPNSSIFWETNLNVTLNVTTFQGNSAEYGIIHFSGGGIFNVSNGTFIDNQGSVIVLYDILSNVDGSQFQRNFPPDQRNRTIIIFGGSIFINNTLFNQNQEGVLFAEGNESVHVHIERSSFSENSVVEGNVFQIHVTKHSSFLLVNSKVTDNRGETIILKGNITSQILNSTFSSNKNHVLLFLELFQGWIENCLFKQNTAASYGVAITAYNVKNLFIINCKFYNNTAENRAGAILIKKALLAEVTNCTFTGNIALNGGGVYMEDIQAARIADSNFTENRAHNAGGGVAFSHEVVGSITNCNFDKNQANFGGACVITIFVKLDIVKCRFKNNYARYKGGAAHSSDYTSLDISESLFFQNKAEVEGGALSLQDDTTLKFFMSNFIENVANHCGAIVAYHKTSLVINQCEFRENIARDECGAVGSASESTLNISRSRFLRNTASGVTGALKVLRQVQCIISESNFVRNSAEEGGAIVASNRVKLTINKCLFKENSAKSYGGALTIWRNSDLHVYDTTWTGNLASYGGAMSLWDNARGTVERSDFDRNKVDELGGAVYAKSITVHFMETNFASNAAKIGGALISSHNSNISITSYLFCRNYADTKGVFFTANLENIQVYNSSFTDNTAIRGGVGTISKHSYLKIQDSILANNTADEIGTLFLAKMVTAEIINTTFFNNTARVIGVVHILNNTKLHLKNVTFDRNYETGVAWLWVLAYMKPYLSRTLAHRFHELAGTSGVITVVYLSNVMADGCLFIDNSAIHAGVFLVHNSLMTVKNSEFIDNNAQIVGVFEAAYGGCIVLANATFKGNQARLADIGRIMANSNVNITNITVHGKTRNRLHFLNMDIAQKSSLRLKKSSLSNIIGAYYMFRIWDSSHVFLNEVLMENNFLYGISYISKGSTLTMDTCSITDNKIEDSIMTLEDRSAADIQNISIKDNVLLVSFKGDNLFHVTQNSTFMITQSQFTENFAAKGELILVQNNSSFVLDNCTFANNSAEYGVLLCKSTDFILFNQTSFVRNEAFVSGGVTFSENCGIQVVNSRMTRSKAQHYGGCVVSVDGILEVSKLE